MSGPWFRCFLPTDLDDTRPVTGSIARDIWIQRDLSPAAPLGNRARFRDRFLPGTHIIWAQDELTQFLTPFWVPTRWQKAVEELSPETSVTELGQNLARALQWAGILSDPKISKQRAESMSERLQAASQQLRRDQFANVSGLLHQGLLSGLRTYYRELILGGGIPTDRSAPLEHSLHNEPLMRFVHHQLTYTAARLTGQPVLPSYCYFKGYRQGASLDRHVDRAQCELTISLLVDFESVQGESANSWPIWLQTPNGPVSILQSVGDALFFRGVQLPHWREPLLTGRASHSLLLHYVHETFAGALY